MRRFLTEAGRWICIVAVALLASRTARGDDAADVKEQLRLLQQQNQQLQEQLNKQQQLIESPTRKISEVETAGQQRESEMHALKAELDNQPATVDEPAKPFSLGKVVPSGEVNVDFTLGIAGLPQY